MSRRGTGPGAYQIAMKDDLVERVEGLTGHKVLAFMSDNHIAPDVAVEISSSKRSRASAYAASGA